MIRTLLPSALLALAECDRTPDAPSPTAPATPAADASPPAPTPAPAVPPAPSPTATPADGSIPAAFRGRWSSSPAGCDRPDEYELTITPDRLRFWESEGVVTAVRADGEQAIDVAARFTGEGETWTASHRLALDDDRLTVTGRGSSTVRERCG